jgi:hypothetical protein
VHTKKDFGVIFERVPLMCDNTSAISVAKKSVFHKIMRHLRRRHHFLRDHIEKGDIKMGYIDTETQLADIFTKPLYASRFAALWGELVFAIPLLSLRENLCSILYIFYLHRFALLSYTPKLTRLHLLYYLVFD